MDEVDVYDIVERIVDDLYDRDGLGDAWDQIKEERRCEIMDSWIAIIREGLGQGAD